MKAVLPIALVFLAGSTHEQTPLVLGVDHTPIVVADLEKAQADFRAMGFAIKAGRFHADGIRNAHVKFQDGTELELITAPRPTDSLTMEYYAKEQRGDGPVYFGLWASNYSSMVARILALGVPVEQDGDLLTFRWPIRSIHCSSASARNLPRIVRSISPTLIRRSGCQAFGCGVINRSVTCWPGWACRCAAFRLAAPWGTQMWRHCRVAMSFSLVASHRTARRSAHASKLGGWMWRRPR